MKDFEYCSSMCREFMIRYKQALEEIKGISFADMSLEECKEFMEYSYKLTENLAYDRFKYALLPTMLVFDRYSKIIKKINTDYTALDFYRGLNDKTAVINDEISQIAKKNIGTQRIKGSCFVRCKF